MAPPGGMDYFEKGALPYIVGSLYGLIRSAGPLPRLVFALSCVVTITVGCFTVIQKPDGEISPFRPYAAIVVPLYFASCALVIGLPNPILCLVLAVLATEAKIGLGMSVCLHRYSAHAAFKCSACTSFALGWLGCMANQGGPLWWASKHRAHHKFCDGPRDPHSALHEGEVLAFMFHGMKKNKAVDEEFVPKHMDSPAMRWLDTLSIVPVMLESWFAFLAFGPAGLWVSYVSAVWCQIITLWFNVANHPVEHSPSPQSDAGCLATDSPHARVPNIMFRLLDYSSFMGKLVGEDTHSHHHDNSQLAHRPGYDLPFHLLVRPLAALGLVWEVKHRERAGQVSLKKTE